jgi:3-oxoacyl-[acyl-carrier protein] reductase
MRMRLGGKAAIVTGAGGGLGRAEALLLAAEGARVVVNNHVRPGHEGRPSADVVVDEIIAAGGTAVASHDDVSDPDGARRLVETAVSAFGGVDILLNNAGIARVAPIDEMSEEQWDSVLGVCLRGTFLVTRAAVPHLRRARGVILNTSSESGLGHAFLSSYAAAKEGVVGLTRSLARELAADGVRVNAVRPRALGTSMGERFARDVAPYLERLGQLGRHRVGDRGGVGGAGSAEEAAPFAVWLCTPAAAGVTGQVFSIEGDTVGVWSQPSLERTCAHAGGWTLDALDATIPSTVFEGLSDRGLSRLFNDFGAAPA